MLIVTCPVCGKEQLTAYIPVDCLRCEATDGPGTGTTMTAKDVTPEDKASVRTKLNIANVGLMAFWRYDLFPFVLCGKIVTMKGNGMVETEEYGRGQWFKPFQILPWVDGAVLKRELEELTDKYHANINKVKKEFLVTAKALIGE